MQPINADFKNVLSMTFMNPTSFLLEFFASIQFLGLRTLYRPTVNSSFNSSFNCTCTTILFHQIKIVIMNNLTKSVFINPASTYARPYNILIVDHLLGNHFCRDTVSQLDGDCSHVTSAVSPRPAIEEVAG